MQLEPYEIYRSFKFGPADTRIRKDVSQRLEPLMLSFIRTKEYQSLSDEDKTLQFLKKAKSIIAQNYQPTLKILIEDARSMQEAGVSPSAIREVLGYNENDINQFQYENMTRRVQRAVEAELGAPTDDSNFAEYLQLAEAKKGLELASGGLVQKFAVGGMPTSALDRTLDDVTGLIADVGVAGYRGDRSIDEQMDELSLDETATVGDEEETQSLSGVIGKIAEVGGEVWDNMNYLDRAALVTAPLPVVGDVTGLIADAYMYATKPEERTAFNYALTGASVVGALPASVTKAILSGSNPAMMGIFMPGNKDPEAMKRYEELMNAPLTKKQEKMIADDPDAIVKIMEEKAEQVRQETGIGVIKGLDDTPRLEISDFSVPLNAVRRKDPLTDKEVFFGIDGLPLGHPNSKLTMGDVFPHADLFEYYPEARNLPIVAERGSGGAFLLPHKGDPARISVGEDVATENALKETLIHELQHFVQWSDRLNAGGNKTAFTLEGLDFLDTIFKEAGKKLHQSDAIQDGLRNASQGYAVGYDDTAWEGFSARILKPLSSTNPDEVERKQKEIRRWFGDELANDLIEYSKLGNEYEKLRQEPFRRYMLLAGEVEARMTGDRLFMSPTIRQRSKPDIADVLKSDERRYDVKYDDYGSDQLIQARHRQLLSDTWGYMFGDAYSKAIKASEKKATDLIDRMRESKAIDVSNDSKVVLSHARTSIQRDSMNKRSYRHINEALDSPQSPRDSSDELWDVPTQKITSADTSINQNKLPAGYSKLKKLGVFKPGQRVVDIGGGRFDNAVEDLAKQDVELLVYDPFNRTSEHNKAVADVIADGGADVAVSNNTLNVIEEPENIKRVIQQAENAIKPGDKAYFTVYAGDRSGKGAQTSKGWQRNEPTSAYVSRVEEVFGEGNVTIKGDLITATKPSNKAYGGLMSRR